MASAATLKGLGALVGEIPLESIQGKAGVSTIPKDLKTLASYNLLSKRKRTIVVPGFPSIWAPADDPKKVKRDAGLYIRDPNRYIFPRSPLEPLFRAIATTQPNFNMKGVDLVTDRRNLRHLLNFVCGKKTALRIGVEAIQSTVLFSCWTQNCLDHIEGFGGYGHEFEKVSTKKPHGMEDSVTHSRIIRYSLGGVNMILRFEVDACTASEEDLHEKMAVLSKHRTPTGYVVLNQGYMVGASRLAEIKTGRSGSRQCKSRLMAQMWFSQTQNLCVGRYDADGVFFNIMQRNLALEGLLLEWESRYREKLSELVRVIEMISEMVRAAPPGKYALVRHLGESALKMYRATDQGDNNIPEDLLTMWKSET
ncbi:hypothetical protein FQN49_002999 [Arthroderma sp. PD_2]|nr:hypothetical protein FQN49_002999 [Arthroderma sp. PD_2]